MTDLNFYRIDFNDGTNYMIAIEKAATLEEAKEKVLKRSSDYRVTDAKQMP